jgi:hypothetical protein
VGLDILEKRKTSYPYLQTSRHTNYAPSLANIIKKLKSKNVGGL